MLGTFAIGMSEYVVIGLLSQIAGDMKVSISTAGLLVSVYALSVAFIGPVMRILTLRYRARVLLPIFVGIFIASNMLGMLAPNFYVLLLSRLLSAAMHAPFFGVSMSVATNIVHPSKRTQAIALVQTGLTIAIMIGVPFGAFLGDLANWRVVFGIMVLVAIATLIGIIKCTPDVEMSAEPNLKKELKAFKQPQIIITIAMIVFGFSGVFTSYTFVEPMLKEISPFGTLGITICLFSFGLGGVIGNVVSGNVTEEKLTIGLFISFLLLFLTIILLVYALPIGALALIIVFLFGFGTFGTTPLLNSKIIFGASDAPLLASTMVGSIFNLANFIGAMIGSGLLGMGLPYAQITLISGSIILIGIVLNIGNYFYESRYQIYK
ncbi:MFS transporter [Staphylococcus ratti]|uniref:MFS transporter n=1 Tax=Staphylococcus ratti TaxID=2892440 RepID=A0ABY3PFX4_9STAP|nr:MFS transporter [Staphylococcus ratti]UEX91099.1 MFS transporter [Staphylococcus ratti]